jgi:PKD repeat protein
MSPQANINASDTFGYVNMEFTFNGKISADDGIIQIYHWDFGDGTNAEGGIVTHRFTYPGTFTITLTVTDSDGLTDSAHIDIVVVQPNMPPSTPVLVGPSDGSINIEYSYLIISTDPDNDSLIYHVDWGDGTQENSTMVPGNTTVGFSHIWNDSGYFQIHIYTQDEHNSVSSIRTHPMIIDVPYTWVDDILKGYFIDEDDDGIFELFFNTVSDNEIPVSLFSENTYALDIDDDNSYDYLYDAQEGRFYSFTTTETKSTVDIYLIAITFILLIIGLGAGLWKIRQKKKEKK